MFQGVENDCVKCDGGRSVQCVYDILVSNIVSVYI
jgi:hypothetical protein